VSLFATDQSCSDHSFVVLCGRLDKDLEPVHSNVIVMKNTIVHVVDCYLYLCELYLQSHKTQQLCQVW